MIDVVAISNDERGRCVVATTELKRGTIVSDETPLVWLKFTDNEDDADADDADDTNDNDEYCHRCFERIQQNISSSVVVECEYCKVEKYCSFDCRRLASAEYHCKHGECCAFETGKEAEKNDPIRHRFYDMPNRFAIRTYAKLGGWTGLEKTMDEKSKVSESLRRHLKDCVAHVTVSSTEQEDNNHFLKTLCSNTRALMDADDVLVKEEDFVRAAYAMRANAHTLYSSCSNLKKKIGVGLFPILSRSFNHSCDPNAEFFNVHLRLRVRLIRDVRNGEEITISYLNNEENKKKRQHRREMLKKQYNFECACVRCVREKQQKA